jgi:hypothetical protein
MTHLTAWFDSRASLLESIEAARHRGVTIVTAILPGYDAEVVREVETDGEVGAGFSRPIGLLASAAGAIGAVAALWFIRWTVGQWPGLIISGKPLLAWPTFVIIAFEMAILSAVLAAFVLFLVRVRRSRRAVRGYDLRKRDAAFALLVTCAPEHVVETEQMFHQHGAVSCHVA